MNLSKNRRNIKYFSKDMDFAQEKMSQICGNHKLETSCKSDIEFNYDGFYLSSNNIFLGILDYGTNMEVNIPNSGKYCISLPLIGNQFLISNGEIIKSNEKFGLILPNKHENNLIIDKKCKKLQVVIPEESVKLILGDLLNRKIKEKIIFDPIMNYSQDNNINTWWKNILNFIDINKALEDSISGSFFLEDYESFIIKSLLLSQQNNYSFDLMSSIVNKIPDHILRVKEYIELNAKYDIRVEDLIFISGISRSKLYSEFKEYFGVTPFIYLKKYRLRKINKIIKSSNNCEKLSISKLAYDWGFNHLGRFSSAYKEEFGITPKETRFL